jgi:hypothetical protein
MMLVGLSKFLLWIFYFFIGLLLLYLIKIFLASDEDKKKKALKTYDKIEDTGGKFLDLIWIVLKWGFIFIIFVLIINLSNN